MNDHLGAPHVGALANLFASDARVAELIPPAPGRSSDGRLWSASNRGWMPPSRGTGSVQNGGARSSRGIVADIFFSNTVGRARSLRGLLEVFREERQGVAAPPSVGIFGFHLWAT